MAQVTIYGVCESDTKIIFNKTIHIDDEEARHISGPKHALIVEKLMKRHFPDLKIHPDQVGVQIIYENPNMNSSGMFTGTQVSGPEAI